jgi:hypothetical protein
MSQHQRVLSTSEPEEELIKQAWRYFPGEAWDVLLKVLIEDIRGIWSTVEIRRR